MALLTSELTRLRFELGYNMLGVAAEPYVEYHAAFDRVVAQYLQAGAKTTSSSVVSASTPPSPVTLTLASATGFSAGDAVVVDVDGRQERARVQALSGSTITLLLGFAHTGTYPVTVEGGESIIRDILAKIYAIDTAQANAVNTAGIKRVDEIEFFGGTLMTSQYRMLQQQRSARRDELASALGVMNLWNLRQGASLTMALY